MLRDGVDDAPQVPPSDGETGTRTAARRSGGGRHVDWRDSGRFAGKPSTERPEGCPRHRRSGEAGKASGRVRMAVIPDFKSVTLNAFVQQNVAPASTIYTDGLKSFVGFEQTGFRHIPRTQPLQGDLRKGAKSVVPFADRAIGNLQQWLIGTYHGVSRDQLQVYLDECKRVTFPPGLFSCGVEGRLSVRLF